MTVAAENQLKGFVAVASVCAEAFLNVPDEKIVSDVRAVSEALGLDWFGDVEASPELEQRYYNRLFVSAHPAYVPLFEDSVRGGYEEDGRFRYGSTDGKHFDHVMRCYRAVGFDYRLLEGCDFATGSLKPDSLASELAFLVFLAQSALDLREADEAASARSIELLKTFSREHAGRWFVKAAERLTCFEDDFYARVAWLAADALAALEDDPEQVG